MWPMAPWHSATRSYHWSIRNCASKKPVSPPADQLPYGLQSSFSKVSAHAWTWSVTHASSCFFCKDSFMHLVYVTNCFRFFVGNLSFDNFIQSPNYLPTWYFVSAKNVAWPILNMPSYMSVWSDIACFMIFLDLTFYSTWIKCSVFWPSDVATSCLSWICHIYAHLRRWRASP
jgi:hypothetical protein